MKRNPIRRRRRRRRGFTFHEQQQMMAIDHQMTICSCSSRSRSIKLFNNNIIVAFDAMRDAM